MNVYDYVLHMPSINQMIHNFYNRGAIADKLVSLLDVKFIDMYTANISKIQIANDILLLYIHYIYSEIKYN